MQRDLEIVNMDQQQKQESAESKEIAAEGGKRSFWKRRPVVVIGTALLFGLLYFGLTYLAQSLTHESTDDAFLDAHIAAVAPKVAGRVRDVPVKDNQVMKTGDLLVDIEPARFSGARSSRSAPPWACHGETWKC